MTITDFLVWLAGGGSIVAISWLLEQWSWYQNQDPMKKKLIFCGLAILTSFVAYAIQTYVPAATLQILAPWFAMVASIFGTIFLGTVFHKADKK